MNLILNNWKFGVLCTPPSSSCRELATFVNLLRAIWPPLAREIVDKMTIKKLCGLQPPKKAHTKNKNVKVVHHHDRKIP